MSRAITKFRPRVPSSAFTIEPLEQRQVLSALLTPGFPSLGPADAPEPLVVETSGAARNATLQELMTVSPSDGAIVPGSAAPGAIRLQLKNAPIASWIDGGVALYQLGADGKTTPIFKDEQTLRAIKDQAANTVTIPLETALAPGRYRVVLVGGVNTLSQFISDGSWDYKADQTLAEFTVAEREGGADSTVDAGVVGSTPQSFAGALEAAGDRVDYKVTLGADRPLWRLGLQLDAERIGSGLTAALTVRDAAGNVVASSEGRRGLASTPNDPYLFAGLQPGTYTVSVAAANGRDGEGAYRLGIVADPITGPTRVTGFALDWTNGAPIGFTIAFSDAIAPESLATTSAPVWAVDARGGIHPAALAAADDGLRRLSFVFDQPLAAGEYHLVEAGQGGLVDLIGQPPVADGPSAGWLATWTVAPYQETSNAPEPPATSWLDGAHLESLIDNAVGSGGALALRFGASVGTTAPSPARSDPTPTPTVAGLTPSFIGVLDSSLFGRPESRSNDGSPSVGPIPARGHALLAHAARERLAGETSTPGWTDDGLIRSPDGLLEATRPEPTADRAAPRLVEFHRDRRGETIDDGAKADADILARIESDRLADAAAALAQWLFGPATPDAGQEADRPDAQLLAQLDAETAPADRDRAEGETSRANLGVPIGVLILTAVAYRLHRHPPRWWRRRRPIEADAAMRHPPVPRGPRFMVPRRLASRRAGATSRKVIHR